ncbi:Elf1-domain-containing protein [Amniculicola lignicola CBS 123094]|uniref:Transcription elongation factor 1 homolog n=1 Tax=Amniculicola lignicola CBS 123094 TaxID=1392246 RepID=A0A6A5WI81_9PLEO|nr:Elf1-domain-containing protein [Amniculicola lignicola CBS 123094]
MGKRKKASKPQGPKRKEKLATVFQCLFCNHEDSVSVLIEKKSGVGNLHCKVCGQTFQTNINYLSAPVDVYADWVDACDAVAKDSEPTVNPMARGGPTKAVAAGGSDDEGGLGDDFIVDDEVDAEGDFADDD